MLLNSFLSFLLAVGGDQGCIDRIEFLHEGVNHSPKNTAARPTSSLSNPDSIQFHQKVESIRTSQQQRMQNRIQSLRRRVSKWSMLWLVHGTDDCSKVTDSCQFLAICRAIYHFCINHSVFVFCWIAVYASMSTWFFWRSLKSGNCCDLPFPYRRVVWLATQSFVVLFFPIYYKLGPSEWIRFQVMQWHHKKG